MTRFGPLRRWGPAVRGARECPFIGCCRFGNGSCRAASRRGALREPRSPPAQRTGERAVSGSAAFLGAGRRRASRGGRDASSGGVRRVGGGEPACPPRAFCHVRGRVLKVVFLAKSGHVDKEQSTSPALTPYQHQHSHIRATKTLRTASRDPTLRHSKRCARGAPWPKSRALAGASKRTPPAPSKRDAVPSRAAAIEAPRPRAAAAALYRGPTPL